MLSIFSYHVKHVNNLLINTPKDFQVTPILFDDNQILFHIEAYADDKKMIRKLFMRDYAFYIEELIFQDNEMVSKKENKIEPKDSKELIMYDLIKNFLSTFIIDDLLHGEDKYTDRYVMKELTGYELTHSLIKSNINTSLFVTSLIHYQSKSNDYMIYQFGDYYSIIKGAINKNGEFSLVQKDGDSSINHPIYGKFNLLNNTASEFSELILKVISEYDLSDLTESVLIDGKYVPIFSV